MNIERLKFRGRHLTGNWVYSGQERNLAQFFGEVGDELIDPSTVGQWTGLSDKNGVDIYEGDRIVDIHDRDASLGTVQWNHHTFAWCVYLDHLEPLTKQLVEQFDSDWFGMVEVVGNIHEANEVKNED